MQEMLIKHVSEDDWEFIRQLRNEQSKWFINQGYISSEEHVKFMKQWGHQYYIGYIEQEIMDDFMDKLYIPVGFIGVRGIDDIRYCVASMYQGRNFGTQLLKYISKLYPDALGKVKIDNIASQKAFVKAGFKARNLDIDFIVFQSLEKEES